MKTLSVFTALVVSLLVSSAAFGQMAANLAPPPLKKIVKTEQAPLPVGPYSQGVISNGFLFLAGQTGVNPQTRQLVTNSFEGETTQVIENLRAILQSAGMDLKHVVKATVYVKDMSNFAKVNEIYGKYFSIEPPARETVQVSNLPGNANIEISVIAAME